MHAPVAQRAALCRPSPRQHLHMLHCPLPAFVPPPQQQRLPFAALTKAAERLVMRHQHAARCHPKRFLKQQLHQFIASGNALYFLGHHSCPPRVVPAPHPASG